MEPETLVELGIVTLQQRIIDLKKAGLPKARG
jgi:hypothetical protein